MKICGSINFLLKQDVDMSDDTSDDSDGFDDDDDEIDSHSHDELASQLASAGPTGVAAAAAISSTRFEQILVVSPVVVVNSCDRNGW